MVAVALIVGMAVAAGLTLYAKKAKLASNMAKFVWQNYMAEH